MNMQQMIQAMQKTQRMYEKERKLIEEKEFTYTANNIVKLTMKGNLEIVSLEILDDDILNKDDKDMLIDMIKIAFDNVKNQINDAENELFEKYQNQSTLGKMF